MSGEQDRAIRLEDLGDLALFPHSIKRYSHALVYVRGFSLPYLWVTPVLAERGRNAWGVGMGCGSALKHCIGKVGLCAPLYLSALGVQIFRPARVADILWKCVAS